MARPTLPAGQEDRKKAADYTPEKQRDRMDEALGVLVKLLRGEEVTHQSDWFELKNARLQMTPYSRPSVEMAVASQVSPTGARAAGTCPGLSPARAAGYNRSCLRRPVTRKQEGPRSVSRTHQTLAPAAARPRRHRAPGGRAAAGADHRPAAAQPRPRVAGGRAPLPGRAAVLAVALAAGTVIAVRRALPVLRELGEFPDDIDMLPAGVPFEDDEEDDDGH